MFLRKLFPPKKVTSKYPNMSFIHRDSDGLDWYQFNDGTTIPLLRLIKLKKFTDVWNLNLDEKELNELIEIVEHAIEDGVKKISNGKLSNMLKIASVIYEMKRRRSEIRHFQVMADILACSFVRSDEVYDLYDKDIHLQKKQYILDQSKKKDPFFLQSNIYKELSKQWSGSEEDFQKLREIQEIEMEIRKRRVEYISTV